MLHFIAGRAARAAALHRGRRDQRAARGAQAARRARQAARPVRRSRSCSTCPRRSARSATARGRTATSAPHVVRQQRAQLRRSLRGLQREGFRRVFVLRSPRGDRRRRGRSASRCGPTAAPSRAVRHHRRRPRLLRRAGRRCCASSATGVDGRRHVGDAARRAARAVFVGDFVDRGPDTPSVLRARHGDGGRRAPRSACRATTTSSSCASSRAATCRSRTGSAETLEQLEARAAASSATRSRDFLDGLVSHFVLDDGKLVVAHAGMKEAYQGRASGRVRDFALFGETTGETDEFGLPVRCSGPPTTAAGARSSTATRRSPSRSGSTTRSTSTPAASSAAG